MIKIQALCGTIIFYDIAYFKAKIQVSKYKVFPRENFIFWNLNLSHPVVTPKINQS